MGYKNIIHEIRQVQNGDQIVILYAPDAWGRNAYQGWAGTVEQVGIEGFCVRREGGGVLVCGGRGAYGVVHDTTDYALIIDGGLRMPFSHSYAELKRRIKQDKWENTIWFKIAKFFKEIVN